MDLKDKIIFVDYEGTLSENPVGSNLDKTVSFNDLLILKRQRSDITTFGVNRIHLMKNKQDIQLSGILFVHFRRNDSLLPLLHILEHIGSFDSILSDMCLWGKYFCPSNHKPVSDSPLPARVVIPSGEV